MDEKMSEVSKYPGGAYCTALDDTRLGIDPGLLAYLAFI